ncbi:hypothetical protein [Streptacidiphilus melanogenes]|uniref:hypothetical protein n=1 Tax=Streptacidiphilus melanogenes TaxID=411235 RepID=UPI0005A663B9|nr:hypothetical protein [Streptacidiphilus melanogenes]
MAEALNFIVWNEVADMLGEFDNAADADACVEREQAACAEICGTDGRDTNGNGAFACGVMSPHGIHVQVEDANGVDRTSDPAIRL